jgi:hypothetical protein
MRKPKETKAAKTEQPKPYVFRAVHKQALGFWHLAPESGKTLAGEAFDAMKAMGAVPDDVFEITIRRASKGG